jgi:hypothetical protein
MFKPPPLSLYWGGLKIFNLEIMLGDTDFKELVGMRTTFFPFRQEDQGETVPASERTELRFNRKLSL